MDLWTPTSVETRLFISSCKYKGVWIYLLIFILKNAIGKQLLPGRVQNCYPNVLFPACAQPRTLCGWKPEWDERTGHNPLLKRWGVPLPQAGHWGSGELSKKAAGVRQMSYPMIGAIFTADADVRLLWGHLTKKGAGLLEIPLLVISLPVHQNLWLKAFLLDHRAYLCPSHLSTWVTYLYRCLEDDSSISQQPLLLSSKAKWKKKKFKCFGKTMVISECPFSTSLVEEGCC